MPFMILSRRHRYTFLVVPKAHICCANAITADNSGVVAHCFEVIAKICRELGVESYRIVNNCGDQAGQTVKHLHFHVLAGRDMTWPPAKGEQKRVGGAAFFSVRRCGRDGAFTPLRGTPYPPLWGHLSPGVGRFADLTGHRPVIQHREPQGKA